MGNYSKYKYVNTAFGGTGGMIVPNGSTAERESAVAVGTVRYNTDLGLLEQYNALGWQSVDAPPTITNIAGTINENTNSTITITGSNFKTGAIVSIEGTAVGGIPRALATTFVSTSTLTAATNATAVNYVGGAPFDVKVVNPSGLSGALSPAGIIDRDPTWTTAAGTYTVFDSARSTPLSFVAIDPDGGQTVTYSLQSGSLPAGATLNTATGAISGFNAVSSDTSTTFTLRATSSFQAQTADRSFTILVRAPISQTFTANGTFTPAFSGTIEYLVVAGGGGGGGWGGGGGAGGVRTGTVAVTPQAYTIVIGGGGARGTSAYTAGGRGGDSSAFGITSNGGGGGGWYNANPAPSGTFGSGGGGGMGESSSGAGAAGTSGQGFAGGTAGTNVSGWTANRGGGGGGASGVGASGVGGAAGSGQGGNGVIWPSGGSTYYGGGGAGHGGYTAGRGIGGLGGGGAGGRYQAIGGDSGAANTGGGGGGAWGGTNELCGLGGSGIVIVRY